MKTLKKIMVVLVASIIAFGSCFALTISSIMVNAVQINDKAVFVKNVPTTLNLEQNSSVQIPFGVDNFTLPTDAGEATVRVYNGTNRVVAEYNKDSTNYLFTPKSAGTYYIVYGYVDTNNVFQRLTDSYALVVTGKVTTITFEENTEFNLPSKVPAKDGQKVIIPFPVIKLSSGKEIKVGDEGYDVTIKVTNQDGEIDATQIGTQNTDYKFITLSDTSRLGIYEVRYEYGNTVMIKNFEVVNKNDFDYTTLKYETTMSAWTENTQRYKGEEITLPSITVKDESSTDVTSSIYNKITVRYVKNGTEVSNADNSVFVLNGYKLIVYEGASTDNSSYYEITYKLTDYFGTEIKTYTIKMTNIISYRNPPAVYAVESYENRNSKIVVADYLIPTKYNYIKDTHDTIRIPAIFAVDNETYNNENFTYTRVIKYTDKEGKIKTITVEKSIKKNENDYYAFNEVADYKLEGVGSYTITYNATSKKTNKTSSNVYYNFNVVDGTESSTEKVDSKPEIKLPALPEIVKAGETIEINLPAVTDKEEGSNAIIDERVETKIEVTNGTVEEIITDYKVTGYKITAGETYTNLVVKFTAVNDNGVTVERNKEIKVLLADEDAATYTVEDNYAVDGKVINLPAIQFEDANKQYLKIRVNVFDPKGNEVVGIKDVVVEGGKINGGIINASLSGKYTIIYTAVDPYSNVTSVAFVTETVIGSTGYIQTGIDSEFVTSVQPNESITLPAAVIELNGEVDDTVSYKLKVVSATGAGYTLNDAREFSATEEGTYVFAYYIGDNKVSKDYTVTVSDTVAPELNISDFRPSTVYGYDAEVGLTIQIPTFSPSDSVSKIITDYGIKITRNGKSFIEYNGKEINEKFYATTDEPATYYFNITGTAKNANGVYVVEYYATDNAGNKASSKVLTLNVGDTDTPEIVFSAEVPTTVNLKDKLTFKDSDIQIKDSSDTKEYKVTMTDPNGKTVENKGADGVYSYEFTSSGEYILKIDADDNQGHTNTLTKTITVASEEYKEPVNTKVLGYILIGVSVLILAGVVIFFIKTRDKTPKIEEETKTIE